MLCIYLCIKIISKKSALATFVCIMYRVYFCRIVSAGKIVRNYQVHQVSLPRQDLTDRDVIRQVSKASNTFLRACLKLATIFCFSFFNIYII